MALSEYIDKVICDDNMNLMERMPDECVDLILTDPPFGIAFMGKDWDKAVPAVDVWRECLRVLKPGAFAFVMCIPRQDCQSRMIVNLQDAGFDVSFTSLYHCFAQGFPKSANVSKLVDKRLGVESIDLGVSPNWRESKRDREKNGSMEVRGQNAGRITIPASPEAKALDGAYSSFQVKPAVECILVCQKPFTTKHKRSDVYKILGGSYDYWYTQRTEVKEPKEDSVGNIDKLSRKYAKELAQVGYMLKDGDVIERRLALRDDLQDEVIVNREVLLWSAPYKDNDITSSITHALDSGKGITFLDDCKIPYETSMDASDAGIHSQKVTNLYGFDKGLENDRFGKGGRFPANILCSDDVLNDGVERKGDPRSVKIAHQPPGKHGIYGKYNGCDSTPNYNDSGSFSRYFSLDAWSEKHLPESVLATFPFLLVPKASKSEKNAGLDGLPAKFHATMGKGIGMREHDPADSRSYYKNAHPTVKPVKLMAYLITMGSRPGDVIFDPYLGSGTTAVAAVTLKRHFIGCDIDPESCKTAELRVKYAREEMQKEQTKQLTFDLAAGG